MKIYCRSHRTNHSITERDAEDLIYALGAEWADAAVSDADSVYEGETGYDLINNFCPVDQLRVFRDGEMYAEHLEQMRESRLACEKIDIMTTEAFEDFDARARHQAHERYEQRVEDASVQSVSTEQSVKWMQWGGLEPNGLGYFETDAKLIVAWVNANGGEAQYRTAVYSISAAHIAVRTVDDWSYAKPGQYVVMGDETFYVKRAALGDYAVRSFSVSSVQPE